MNHNKVTKSKCRKLNSANSCRPWYRVNYEISKSLLTSLVYLTLLSNLLNLKVTTRSKWIRFYTGSSFLSFCSPFHTICSIDCVKQIFNQSGGMQWVDSGGPFCVKSHNFSWKTNLKSYFYAPFSCEEALRNTSALQIQRNKNIHCFKKKPIHRFFRIENHWSCVTYLAMLPEL